MKKSVINILLNYGYILTWTINDLKNNKFKDKYSIILNAEDYILKELLYDFLLVVKDQDIEPTPFETFIHPLYTSFSDQETNSIKLLYELRIKYENEHKILFDSLISDYRKLINKTFENKENYIKEIRAFCGFKRI